MNERQSNRLARAVRVGGVKALSTPASRVRFPLPPLSKE